MNQPKPLQDKVILITGANRGIGRALSLLVAKLGAEVILVGRAIKQLESLYDEIEALGAKEPAIYPINLLQATPDHIIELKNNIEGLFGRLDILVHNAGITGPLTPIAQLAPHDWQQILQINLNVPYLLTHGLLPLLQKSKAGKILFPIPNDLDHTKAFWGAYQASKQGLKSLATCLSKELNHTTVESHCIMLPKTQTDATLKAYPGLKKEDFCDTNTTASYYLPFMGLKETTEESLTVS